MAYGAVKQTDTDPNTDYETVSTAVPRVSPSMPLPAQPTTGESVYELMN